MDIYFCDLCGVRVTDIDLKGGHGLRSGHDVICATCLELGHGKEWLAKRQVQLKPTPGSSRPGKSALAAAPTAAVAAGESRQSAAALLDRARDRARTAEENQTPAIGVQVLADESDGEEALAHSEPSELEQESGANPELKQVENHSTTLAAAASSFSALGASPVAKERPASHAADDLDDPADDSDAETQAVASAHGDAGADGDEVEEPAAAEEAAGESPFSFKGGAGKPTAKAAAGKAGAVATPFDDDDDDAERKVNQKDETLPTDRPPSSRPEAKASSPSTAATKRSSTKNSKVNKSSPKTSGRGARPKNNNNNRTVIILGCITLPLLLVMIYLTMVRPNGHKERQVDKINISEELRKSIVNARLQATDALHPPVKVKETLEAAREKIIAVRLKLEVFEAEAKKVGMSDDDINRSVEAAHWPDVNSLIRVINDEIGKLNNHDSK